MAAKTLCDFASVTAEQFCGETLAGIANVAYIGFKGDLKALPKFKTATETMADFVNIEPEPGFGFKNGKCFYKWEFTAETGQLTYSSNGQGKGFTQTFVMKLDRQDAEAAALYRVMNNRKDIFILIPEGDHYVCIYDPDRNVKIDSGGIAGDSGTTPDSDNGVTITMTLPTIAPKTFYAGTVTTEPAPDSAA